MSDRSGRAHEGDGCGPGIFEGDYFPGICIGQQRAQQLVVECMSRLEAAELTHQALAQQIKITDGIENLVLDELVLVPQAVFVEYTILIHHDGVIHAATQRQILRTQVFDVAHEPEGARTTDFLDEGSAGEIHAGELTPATEDRMIEVDAERYLEALEGNEGSRLAIFLDSDFTLDAYELFRCLLLFDAR